ncbi:hypothetical protein HYZ97_02960 [Candidatus Pacearchaeota archaeon]|nr:hypothetical protein [Candidatus Pacearchaeota archaeon]
MSGDFSGERLVNEIPYRRDLNNRVLDEFAGRFVCYANGIHIATSNNEERRGEFIRRLRQTRKNYLFVPEDPIPDRTEHR